MTQTNLRNGPDASGLFNLMRNLGGAIGLALIDTTIYTRADTHGQAIADRSHFAPRVPIKPVAISAILAAEQAVRDAL